MDNKMPRSKDRSRSEREKLRGLSFKDKVWYIWNYYNFHIAGVIILTVIIISIVRSVLYNPDTVLFVAWDSPYAEYNDLNALNETLNEIIVGDDTGKIVEVVHMFTISDNPQILMQHYERLMAMITARAIDILVVDYLTLQEYSYLELLLPLDTILSQIHALNPEVYELVAAETRIEYHGYEEDTISEQITGIRISDCPLIRNFETPLSQDAFLCVSITAENIENITLSIIELFS